MALYVYFYPLESLSMNPAIPIVNLPGPPPKHLKPHKDQNVGLSRGFEVIALLGFCGALSRIVLRANMKKAKILLNNKLVQVSQIPNPKP